MWEGKRNEAINEQKVGLLYVRECTELEQIQGFKCEKQKIMQPAAVGVCEDGLMTTRANHTQTR